MDGRAVLVADDEATVRYVVRKMLGDEYIIIEATNGEEALDTARHDQPDIILMDIMMPKTDEATKHIPIIMLTAVGLELNKKLAQTMGAAGYITKPFKSTELLEMISRLLPVS